MNIFEKIIAKKIPTDKVYEDEDVIAIKDIAPKARIHILIIPKKCYESLQKVPQEDLLLIAHVAKVVQNLAKKFQISEGYRLTTNVGHLGGQEIPHLHFHLLGGEKLKDIT